MDALKHVIHKPNAPPPLGPMTQTDALLRTMLARLDSIEAKVDRQMALTQAETDAINQLSTDIDAALAAATSGQGSLQGVVDGLNAQLTALQAQDNADQAQVAALTKSVADLQAVVDGASNDVVTALQGLDAHVKSATAGAAPTDGGATTTTTTTPAPTPPTGEVASTTPDQTAATPDTGSTVAGGTPPVGGATF
jgi:chromosome segregation ATPase